MLIDRQLGDGTIFARRAAAAEQKEEEELQDQMERGNDGADSFDTESAKEESDNNNGGKPRPARQETPGRGGAALRDENSTTDILPGSYLASSVRLRTQQFPLFAEKYTEAGGSSPEFCCAKLKSLKYRDDQWFLD